MERATGSGLREQRRQVVLERILDAALATFADRGYSATTVDQIAERANLARRTVFNHFPRKRDMLAVWADQRRALAASIIATSQSRRPTARHQLELQMDALAQANEDDPRMARVLATGWLAELGVLDEPFPLFDSFVYSIRRGQRRGELRSSVPADAVAEVLVACYTDTLHRWLQSRETHGALFSLGATLRTKLAVVLDGVAVPDADKREAARTDPEGKTAPS